MLFFPKKASGDWWDAFDSASGVPPVLVLDWENDRYMSDTGAGQTARTFADLHTFVRASTALYRDNAGVMQTAAIDTKRLDHDKDGLNKRFLMEEARTNICLWSDDWTDAAWDTVTNMTVAKDQTGVDDVANSASSLLATAANAIVTQSITSASAERTFSVFIKRITGTGTVEITVDGGTTWVDITSQINTSDFIQVDTGAQTVANPVVGIRLVTDTDKIAVQYGDCQTGSFATSPIPTTTVSVTRAVENGVDILFDITGEFSAILAVAITGRDAVDGQLMHQRLSTDIGHVLGVAWVNATPDIGVTYKEIITNDKTVNYQVAHGVTAAQDVKIGARYKDNDHNLYIDGVSKSTDTSCIFNTLDFDEFKIGGSLTVAGQHFGIARFKYLVLYASGLSNSDLAAGTT